MIPFDDIPNVTKECLFTFKPMQREIPTYGNQTGAPQGPVTEPPKVIPADYLSNLSLLQSAAAQAQQHQQPNSVDMAQAQIQAQYLWSTLSQVPNAAATVAAAAAGLTANPDMWSVSSSAFHVDILSIFVTMCDDLVCF